MNKIAKVGASSLHWRSVARSYWQSLHKRGELRLPLSTAASCLPAQERLFTACPPNHVDNWSVADASNRFRDGCHTGLCWISTVKTMSHFPPCKLLPRIDKPRSSQGESDFSSKIRKGLS